MPHFNNDPVIAKSNSDNAPAVQGEGHQFEGVRGISHNAHGAVVGINDHAPASPPGAGGNGGWFESAQGEGVRGWAKTIHHGGVVGVNSAGGFGVYGQSDGSGVVGESKTWMGVHGRSESTTGGAGVIGEGDPGPGVIGKSTKWAGVYGETADIENGSAGVWGEHKGAGTGIKAVSKDGAGLGAFSDSNEAVHAVTSSPNTAAIAAYNLNPAGTGAALFAKKAGTEGHAGFFDGRVFISGDLGVGGDIQLVNADCAENFDVAPMCDAEPGTVVRITDGGAIVPSTEPYDHRAAGVVSGAGHYRPGLLLDSRGGEGRRPVAMIGKVFCKVDADAASIDIGDLLTTSAMSGHAMKAVDRERAFGAVIGKALAPLASGQGLIPILVALN